MSLTLIVAKSSNHVIGDSTTNKMPWHCKEELKHFKETTMGGTLVMGRITAESVGKLPGRDAIVLSNQKDYTLPGFTTMTIGEFLALSKFTTDIKYFICGGAEIYKQLSQYCEEIIISYMKFECEGDVLFPKSGILTNHIIAKFKSFDEFNVFYYEKVEDIV